MSVTNVLVTNFNKNFTRVSATTAGVVALQSEQLDMRLVGVPVPNCPVPISKRAAILVSRHRPTDAPFTIWDVRRNPKMRTAIWVRDVSKYPIKIVFTSAAQRRHSIYPRWLISKMDALIATTPEAASFVDNVRKGVPHGVATDRFLPFPNREKSWRDLGFSEKFGVACVGRVRPEKGTDVFVDAMLQVLPQYPDMVALVIGKAAAEHRAIETKLREKVVAAGLANQLRFSGEISTERMPDVMAAISLSVALPRYEGYGMTALEALSCGTPFVASKTGYFETFSNSEQLLMLEILMPLRNP